MRLVRALGALAAASALGGLTGCAAGRPLAPPQAQAFAADQIVLGAGLARLGDCQACHTSDGGAAFAGGRAIGTPFGTIYATNITPDLQTGIGRYSRAAFVRAMRRGVRRDGAQLYPAFPYDHFTYASDGDLGALYAFMMTRRPVPAVTPPNRLIPPAGFRPVMGLWKALFFRPARFTPSPARGEPWNRGAYLVQSLGHCGACHTPHNALGAERRGQALDGGWAEGWYAPPLNAMSPASTPWTADRLYVYLRTGLDAGHAAAAGPMGAVVHELARAPESDVRALSVYLAAQMQSAPGSRLVDHAERAAREHPAGATLFAGACAVCHEPGGGMMLEGRPPLQLGTPLHEADPRDTLQIIRQGLKPPAGPSGPYMPAFSDSFTDAQLAELAAYLRTRYADEPPLPNLAAAAGKARREGAS